jgi:hypothetical protein
MRKAPPPFSLGYGAKHAASCSCDVLREPRFFGKKAFDEDMEAKKRSWGNVEAIGTGRYQYTCPDCYFREASLGLAVMKQMADDQAARAAAEQRSRQQPKYGPARGGQFGGGINTG